MPLCAAQFAVLLLGGAGLFPVTVPSRMAVLMAAGNLSAGSPGRLLRLDPCTVRGLYVPVTFADSACRLRRLLLVACRALRRHQGREVVKCLLNDFIVGFSPDL